MVFPLIKLPQDIFRVVFEYLTIRDIIKAEEAFLNNQELLSFYKSSLEGFKLTEYIRIRLQAGNLFPGIIISHNLFVEKLELYILRDSEIDLLHHIRFTIKELIIHIPSNSSVSPSEFSRIGSLPSLTTVTFHTCHWMRNDILIHFFSLHPQLETVKLIDMYLVTVDILSHLSNSCPNIKFLSIESNYWVNDETIFLLIDKFPLLKLINIRWTMITKEDTLREFILSRPQLVGITFHFNELSNEFLLFYLNEVIFPRTLKHRDRETHALFINSLMNNVHAGHFGKFPSLPLPPFPSHRLIVSSKEHLITPELFNLNILNKLYYEDCSYETFQDTKELFRLISDYPSMLNLMKRLKFFRSLDIREYN